MCKSPRTLLILAAVAASAFVTSPAAAQRHGRRADMRARVHGAAVTSANAAVEPADEPADTTVITDSTACGQQNCDEDFNVSVVSALFPYDDGRTVGPPLLTLVLQNKGTTRSPGSVVAVAPRNHLSLVSRLTVPPLEPGEKSVVQIPLQMGPDGAPCIAITINPSNVPTAEESIRFASAAPLINGGIGAPRAPGR